MDAISTDPAKGRGIKDFKVSAEGFGVQHFSCNGSDFNDTYETSYECFKYIKEQQKPALYIKISTVSHILRLQIMP